MSVSKSKILMIIKIGDILNPSKHMRPNILVLCGRNKRRSRTTEYHFKNDDRFNICSVSLSPNSEHTLSEKDLQWEEYIFVIENSQKRMIREQF